jgi:hypothetical protein
VTGKRQWERRPKERDREIEREKLASDVSDVQIFVIVMNMCVCPTRLLTGRLI